MQDSKQKEYWNTAVQDPLIEEVLKYKNQGSALDLGSGTGRDAIFLAKNGFDVTAVDNDKIHHENLSNKISTQALPIRQVLADIYEYQPDSFFDVIVCDMVLHFFDQERIQLAIKNMQAWANADGLNVIVGYSDKNSEGKRPYLFRHNELKDYYRDWQILRYEEKPTPWFKLPNETKPRRNHAVYLLAQKL